MYRMYRVSTIVRPVLKKTRNFSTIVKDLNDRSKTLENKYAQEEQKRLIKKLQEQLKHEKKKLKKLDK